MQSLLERCNKLESIDLSNFDTSQVTDMSWIFYNCFNLKYVNLSFFDASNTKTIYKMFENCNSLIYINLYLYKLNNSANREDAFPSNINICTRHIDSEYDNIIFNCTDTCQNENNIKIDITNNICFESCDDDKYDYNNFCFYKCPKYTILKDKICKDNRCKFDNSNDCRGLTPKYYFLDNNDYLYKDCYNKCNYCYGIGNDSNNNCIECRPPNILLEETNNYNC